MGEDSVALDDTDRAKVLSSFLNSVLRADAGFRGALDLLLEP